MGQFALHRASASCIFCLCLYYIFNFDSKYFRVNGMFGDGLNDYEDDSNFLRPMQPIEHHAPSAPAEAIASADSGQLLAVLFLTFLAFLPCICCGCMILCCCQDPECRGSVHEFLANLIRKLKGLKKLVQEDREDDDDEEDDEDEEKCERRSRRRHRSRSKKSDDCTPLIRLPVCPDVPITITVTTDEENNDFGFGDYLSEENCFVPLCPPNRYYGQGEEPRGYEPSPARVMPPPPPEPPDKAPTPEAQSAPRAPSQDNNSNSKPNEDLEEFPFPEDSVPEPDPSREVDPKYLQRKPTLSLFDPKIYDRHILVFSGMPEDTDPEFFKNNFPGKIIESLEDGKGGRDFRIEFQSFEDARTPYKTALQLEYRGQLLDVEPIKRPPPRISIKKPTLTDVSESEDLGKTTTPPDEVTPPPPKKGRSLSDFDPNVYNRNVLEFHGLPSTVNVTYLEQLFPNGTITMAEGAKGGWDAELSFQNFEDARKAFRIADAHPTIEGISNVVPKLKSHPSLNSEEDDFEIETKYVNPKAVPSKKIPYFAQFFKPTRRQSPKEEPPEPPQIEKDPTPPPSPPQPSPAASTATTAPSIPVTAPSSVSASVPQSQSSVIPKPKSKGKQTSASPSSTKSKTKGEPYFPPDGNAKYFKTRPKTKLTLKDNWSPLEYDHSILDVHNIPVGTQKLQIEKWFPKATVQSFAADPAESGKLIAILQFKSDREAEKAFHENHGQIMNGQELKISPVKLDPDQRAEALQKEQARFKELQDKAKEAKSKSKNKLKK